MRSQRGGRDRIGNSRPPARQPGRPRHNMPPVGSHFIVVRPSWPHSLTSKLCRLEACTTTSHHNRFVEFRGTGLIPSEGPRLPLCHPDRRPKAGAEGSVGWLEEARSLETSPQACLSESCESNGSLLSVGMDRVRSITTPDRCRRPLFADADPCRCP